MIEQKNNGGIRRERGRVAVGHPVDVASGEFFGDHSDFELDGVVPLTLTRRYSTRFLEVPLLEAAVEDVPIEPFGPGWRASWQWELRQTLDGFIVADGDGTEYRFRDGREPSAEFAAIGVLRSAKDAVELVRIDRWRIRFVRYGLQREPISHVFVWSDTARAFFLESIERTREARIEVRYDARGHVVGLFQTVGQRLLRLDWDDERVARTVLLLPDGTERLIADYVYDRGVLTEVHDRDGLAERFSYDANFRMVRIDYRSGATHVARYDAKGRCVYVSGSDRYDEHTLRYEERLRTTWVTDSKGATTKYFYNEHGQVLREESPLGTVRMHEFDDYARPTVTHRPNGAVDIIVYDELGRTRQMIRPNGSARAFTHDTSHRVISVTDESGACTQLGYDEVHNIVCATLANGAEWRCRWTQYAQCVEIQNPLGHQKFWTFDKWGNAVNESDWRGNVWTSTFNGLGHCLTRLDPLGHTTYFAYNERDELVRQVDPDGRRWEWHTDAARRETVHIRPDGRRSTVFRSTCGLPIESVDEEGRRTRYEWDTVPRRLLRIVDANGNVYAFSHDAEGNIVRRRTFDGRTIIHRWEKGLLRETVDGAGSVIHWRYDEMDRLVDRRSQGDTTGYSYDVAGNLAKVDDNGTITEFKYDVLGNCIEEIQDGIVLRRKYDLIGNTIALVVPAFEDETRYTFDANGRCATLERAAHHVRLTRDPLGREIKRQLPEGSEYEQTYDPCGRLVKQLLVGESHHSRQNVHRDIQYNFPGGAETVNDSLRGSTTFIHDATETLTGVLHPDGSGERYVHDGVGNRTRVLRSTHGRELLTSASGYELATAQRLGATLETATFEQNRIIRVVGPERVVEYSYDHAGRTIAKTVRTKEHAATTHFAWNTKGQISSVTLPSGDVWRYRYDAFGRRVAKISPDGREERFVWDGFRIAHQTDGSQLRTTWSYLPMEMCPIIKEDETVHYLVPDALRTPAEVVGPGGDLQHVVKKGVWGERFVGGPAMQPGYGQWFDEETGLHYNVFRYYDPETARFLSPDPIGILGGANEYAGVSSPVMWIDPLGLTDEKSQACGPLGIGDLYAAHMQGKAGLLADLDKDGILNLYIKVGPGTPRGSEMFREALAAFGTNVKGVRGTWLGGGDIADNFNSFKAAIAAGHTEQSAAFETFTGKMAGRSGFTESKVTQNDSKKVVVEFTRAR